MRKKDFRSVSAGMWWIALMMGMLWVSCAPSGTSGVANLAPTPPGTTSGPVAPLSWEQYPENRPWSIYLYGLIDQSYFSIFDSASDIVDFCPNYQNLTRAQRITVMCQIFSADSYYESSWDQYNRYEEPGGQIDELTGLPLYSEGLEQLSYQDELNGYEVQDGCRISWAEDKNLSPTDPNKTIFNADINLQCAVIIMAHQIQTRGAIVVQTDPYWSTLQGGGPYSKVPEIEAAVGAFSFCN